MNKFLLLTAVAGLAGTAGAQSVTIHFDADGDPLGASNVVAGIGDTVSWTVYASFSGYDDPTAYFGGFVGAFRSNNPAAAAASNVQTLLEGEGTPPVINGADIESINVFNSALLGTNDPANPIAIVTFDTQVLTFEGFNYFSDGTSSVFADSGIFTLPDEFESASIISDSVIIPAPGGTALLGMCGLALLRKRR
jgi:hypothetical protein